MQPNKPNIDKLLARLRSIKPQQFNMYGWNREGFGECGTVACMGGWANQIMFDEGLIEDIGPEFDCLIGKWLGIEEWSALFYTITHRKYGLITLPAAIRLLEFARDNGGKLNYDYAFAIEENTP